MILNNHITEENFLKAFPRPYMVRALQPWEADRAGLTQDRTWWKFVQSFTFLSDKWGQITQAAGNITDFASVPQVLRNIYDDDSPIMLFPSAGHDLLFQQRPDGTRGWLGNRQLTLHQVNEVLTEAMWYCGATATARRQVFEAVTIGNFSIRGQFATPSAKENAFAQRSIVKASKQLQA